MKKDITILVLFAGLIFSMACNPKVKELTKDLIPKLFPNDIYLGQNLGERPIEIRRTTNGQFLVDNENNQMQRMILLTSSDEDSGDLDGAFIIDPDVDTATGVVIPDVTSLNELQPNSVISAILKLNDSTFLDTDIIIGDLINGVRDSTTVITGIINKDNRTEGTNVIQTLRDAEQDFTHIKTLWIYQQDSVNLFLRQSQLTQ